MDSRYYYLGSQMAIDPRYRMTITGFKANGSVAFSVSGNTQSDFNITGGNSYGDRGSAIAGMLGRTAIGSTAVGLHEMAQQASEAATGANRFLTQIGTELTWQGSKAPSFNLDLTFVCLKSGDANEDVVKKVTALMAGVYPDINKGGLFNPPLGYNTSTSNSGKVVVKIGRWFYAERMVIEDVNFTYSKEVNREGKPLYAMGSVTVRPFRTISYKEFKSWFRM